MKESITCPKCKMTSHHPMDIKYGWCANCDEFHYEVEQMTNLNLVMGSIQRRLRGHLASGEPFSYQFETFLGEDGTYKWRVLIKLGSIVWKHSRLEHETPTDALRELSETIESGRY